MRILLQFPEGLKKLALAEAKKLEGKGHVVFVSSAPCFGACDLALEEAKAVKADKLMHWGHSDFWVKTEIPVEYVEYQVKVDVKKTIRKAVPILAKFKKIGLVTTVQHIKQLPEMKLELERTGKVVFIVKGTKTKYPGQVLGCDAGAASSIAKKVDCFVYFGGGLFHALMDVEKPVLRVDPYSMSAEWLDSEIALERNRRKGAMNALALAKRVGILMSTKSGQMNLKGAVEAKRALEDAGKECVVLVTNFIDFSALKNFGDFDCFVNTACQRISDDTELAGKPIINLQDALYVARLLK